MPSLTVENYLKAIWQIGATTGSSSVSTGKLAQSLKVSPGTVTSMQKALAEAGLASYRPYEGVSLTEAGRTLALADVTASSVDRAISRADARPDVGSSPRRGREHGARGQ